MNSDKIDTPADSQADTAHEALAGKPDDAADKAPRRGPGAPRGNDNRMKHGMRSQRTGRNGFTCSRLHKKLGTYYGDVIKMRRAIERVLIQQYGGIDLLKQAKIQSLCRLETACRCLEWIERSNSNMPAEELKSQRHSIAQWTFQRDNLLADLLGQKSVVSDPWQAVDAMPRPMPTSDTPSGNDAIVDAVSDVGHGLEGNANE